MLARRNTSTSYQCSPAAASRTLATSALSAGSLPLPSAASREICSCELLPVRIFSASDDEMRSVFRNFWILPRGQICQYTDW